MPIADELDDERGERAISAAPAAQMWATGIRHVGEPARLIADHIQAKVRIHLVGSMRAVTIHGNDLLPNNKRACAILAICCLANGRAVSRHLLARMLWDRVSIEQAQNSFRVCLAALEKCLHAAGVCILRRNRSSVWVDMSSVWVDAVAVATSAAVATGSQSVAADLLAICKGRLLEDLEDVSRPFRDWLEQERQTHQSTIYTVLSAELERAGATAMPAAERVAIARRLIEIEPTYDPAWPLLIRSLAESGDRAGALREFGRCKDLHERNGIAPSRELTALVEQIKASERPNASAARRSSLGKQTVNARSNARSSVAGRLRLRVAVLPFRPFGDIGDADLPLVLSQSIGGALSLFRWFDVIMPVSLMAANASAAQPDVARLSDELGIDYVLTGTLARVRGEIKVSVQLCDARAELVPKWSTELGLAVDDIAKFGDLITGPIVANVDPVILHIEGQPNRTMNSGLREATQLVLRAIAMFYLLERSNFEAAGEMLRRARRLDPNHAMAASWSAYWELFRIGQGWSPDPKVSMHLVEECCRAALQSEPDNAMALGILGHVCSFLRHEFEAAKHYLDQALTCNPNLAFVWALSAPTYCYDGQPEVALARLERYQRLAPLDPHAKTYRTIYTMVYLALRDYPKAVAIGKQATRDNPHFSNGYKPLISALGHLGRRLEAKDYVEALLRLEPDFSIAQFTASYPFRRESDRRHYVSGLVKAGVPKG
jgi:DNA-binding SARP family transcriptional activator/Flp pilus assembly protein TadD